MNPEGRTQSPRALSQHGRKSSSVTSMSGSESIDLVCTNSTALKILPHSYGAMTC